MSAGCAAAALVGCNGSDASAWGLGGVGAKGSSPSAGPAKKVPYPVSLLLPKEIKLASFTGTRTFDEAGGIRGLDVRIKAVDAYGDPTKAFGEFRFELYQFRPNNKDPKGPLLGRWRVDLNDPKVNVRHWDNIPPRYKFRLKWNRPIPVGKRFVLVAVFTSPFTVRMFDERTFVAGE